MNNIKHELTKKYHVIGLMSGSSLDGLDLTYCRFETVNGVLSWKLLAANTLSYNERWSTRLQHLVKQDALTFAKTNVYYSYYLATLVQQFIQENNIELIDAIASHGHTIFHDPDKSFTTQIGDGAALAAKTGHTVVSNFRNQDVALGGEGAPFAPIVERDLFKDYALFLNIGGIANFSVNIQNKIRAFDICAANQILNRLAKEAKGLAYDVNGDLARNGIVEPILLDILNKDSFCKKAYPKSLGNSYVVNNILPKVMLFPASWENKLATVVEHIALQLKYVLTKPSSSELSS